MEFGLPLISVESTVSKLNIKRTPRITEEDSEAATNTKAINEYIDVSNDTLVRTLLGEPQDTITPENEHLIDTSQYTTRLTPCRDAIQAGDLVVIQQTFNKLDFVYCQPGQVYSNRNGDFPHDDFIGKPFGTKLRSRNFKGYGFLYILKPTPELWTRSLNHRTQVIHELDQSQIVLELDIVPNCIVLESGTGSGALSHALLRTLAPHGHLHTYEFHQERCATARAEFAHHGLDHLVTVHHRDVCEEGFSLHQQKARAVILDLPEPWRALPHAACVLECGGGKLASYSPCMEQTQRMVAALEASHFHSIRTMEYRFKEYYVDELDVEPPPTTRRPQRYARMDTKKEEDNDVKMDKTDERGQEKANGTEAGTTDVGEQEKSKGEATKSAKKRPAPSNTSADEQPKKLLVARPFSSMRGHTAFITFATAGLLPQPDPLQKSEE